jgi:hypothetical protein
MRRAATLQHGLNHLQTDGRHLIEPISLLTTGRSLVKVHPCAKQRQRKPCLSTGTPLFKTEPLAIYLVLDPLGICFPDSFVLSHRLNFRDSRLHRASRWRATSASPGTSW